MSASDHEPARRTVLRGGVIETGESCAATAMCVEGDTITLVGTDAEADSYLDGADEIVELAGRVVTPAFVDAHVHLSHTGLRLAGLDLSAARDKHDVLAALERYARTSSAAIIVGYGWDETDWRDPTLPTADELDRAAPGRAVYLARVDAHSALVSATLAASVRGLRDAPGWSAKGRVERTAHHLVRDAADAMITPAAREDALRAALDAAAAAGIGSVHEMAAPNLNPRADLEILRRLTATEETIDVRAYWGEHADDGGIEHARELGCVGVGGDLCIDGALGSRTAALTEPYADAPDGPDHRPDQHGHLYLDAESVARHVIACTNAGLAAGFHCIGDAAIETAVAGFRAAAATVGIEPLRRARHRLEHAELFAPELHHEAATYGLVVSAQPAFDTAWGGTTGMYAARLGTERAAEANPFAALHAAGIPLAFGSDSPVTPLDPIAGVLGASQHRTERHRLDARTALAAHTRGGWYAVGIDDAGVLRPGSAATYAIWATEPDEPMPWRRAGAPSPACVRTVVGGRVVFSAADDLAG